MVGMWSLIIWDKNTKKIFISRDRFGQKPLYARRVNNSWLFSSEIEPLLAENEHPLSDPTALIEYLALGNYGHLGAHTFFKEIRQFSPSCYAWLSSDDNDIDAQKYWILPGVSKKIKYLLTAKPKKGCMILLLKPFYLKLCQMFLSALRFPVV